MFITIAVIFVLLATFLLIIINMYSDYVSRREQDARLIANKVNNIIAECEELLLNQSQVAFQKHLYWYFITVLFELYAKEPLIQNAEKKLKSVSPMKSE